MTFFFVNAEKIIPAIPEVRKSECRTLGKGGGGASAKVTSSEMEGRGGQNRVFCGEVISERPVRYV